MRLIHELRAKYPAMSQRATRSPLAAIRLFCLECMGGSPGEVTSCSCSECSLHPFRFDRRPLVESIFRSGKAPETDDVGGDSTPPVSDPEITGNA